MDSMQEESKKRQNNKELEDVMNTSKGLTTKTGDTKINGQKIPL